MLCKLVFTLTSLKIELRRKGRVLGVKGEKEETRTRDEGADERE